VLPDESQRSHWYAYELTGPLQLPLLADNVFPTTGDPLIAGEEVDVGGCLPGALAPPPFPLPLPAILPPGNRKISARPKVARAHTAGRVRICRAWLVRLSYALGEVVVTSRPFLVSGVPPRLRLMGA
jgi:hypothetical protein